MSAKTGIYCVVYDSTCLTKEVNQSRRKEGAAPEDKEILSFRDHLQKTDPVVKTDFAPDNSSFCGGITSDGSPLFELDWDWTPNGWKIVAIPYL